jgi:uncharacterized membrane protein
MNWKLILQLSLIGMAMAIGTVYFIPSNIEPAFWLVIFLLCAYLIAKKCSEKYFLTGLLVSLVNCVWITSVHVILFDAYAANHPEEIAMTPEGISPRMMMLVAGPIVGVVSGLVLGLFAFIASKIRKKKA